MPCKIIFCRMHAIGSRTLSLAFCSPAWILLILLLFKRSWLAASPYLIHSFTVRGSLWPSDRDQKMELSLPRGWLQPVFFLWKYSAWKVFTLPVPTGLRKKKKIWQNAENIVSSHQSWTTSMGWIQWKGPEEVGRQEVPTPERVLCIASSFHSLNWVKNITNLTYKSCYLLPPCAPKQTK